MAILFMEPRTRNADDSLLAEGLTLEIIDQLGGITRLDVRSRFVSRHIAAASDPMADARALGVDYVVDGVIEMDTSRVLMRGALTRTSTGRVVRPIRVERYRSELARLQATVAQDVAAAVVGELVPSERARLRVRPISPVAHDLLLRARALNHQYTEQAYRQAIRLLAEAARRDSANADVWTELATSYWGLKDFEPGPERLADIARFQTAMARALALDSSNGAAMVGVSLSRVYHNDVGPETEALVRRGLASSRSGYAAGGAAVLISRGRADDGIRVLRDAVARDSLSPALWISLGARLLDVRRYGEASQAVDRALALRPLQSDSLFSFFLPYLRNVVLLDRGECAAAAELASARSDPLLLVQGLRCQRRITEADSVIAAVLAYPTIDPLTRAAFLALAAQPDSAFALLDRAYPPGLVPFLMRAEYDPFRQHPGYLALRRRMGLDR